MESLAARLKFLADQKKFNEETGLSLNTKDFEKRESAVNAQRSAASDAAIKSEAVRKEVAIAGGDPNSVKDVKAGMSGQAAGQAAIAGLQAAGVGDNPESTAGIGMSAASGAMTGSMIAPGVGTAVGAVVGGTIGLLKARSARKKRAREAAAKAHANIGVIRQQEQKNISSALDNIRQGFQSSLIRNTPQVRF